MGLLDIFFGDTNEREIKRLEPTVAIINDLEKDYEKLDTEGLRRKTTDFKERLAKGETLDNILPEAYAAVREAAKRTLGQRHYDVQLMAGIVLHQGKIAEMKTGEGKTLVATLPLYLNALSSKGAHLITTNDYLARVGGGWMAKIYHALGISVAVIAHEFSALYNPDYTDTQDHGDDRLNHWQPCTRQEAYRADITYGTNNEFGFDYLRDNMAVDSSQLSQRELNYAIVDEVDSILIDEARTPLIISAPAEESTSLYQQFARLVPQLKKDDDYKVDEKDRAATLTDSGIKKMEKLLGFSNIYDPKNVKLIHHLEEALKAYALFKKDKDYVVKDGEVIIVDEFTGRLMQGRRYSEGLHQAIEAKEDVEVKRESDTLATITFQNLFRMYNKLSGMTGTAATEAEEFYKIYKLDVVEIPTNRPLVRIDKDDLIYKTHEAKLNAIVEDVRERVKNGQPVLIGTISIEKNEELSRYLKRAV
ncbi:MAG: preprotein translocase subunit SecA, partial [Patescibacteria group bacterium]|nr:preprotein translocase subunit SecA [Patescibacteria group bacterium]